MSEPNPDDVTQADRDAADAHFDIWYPDTAWGFDALAEAFAQHRVEQHDYLYSRMMQFRAANQALRRGLYGIIDSDDADTIATTLEAGGDVDWSEYPEGTHAALGDCQ